MNSDQPAGVSMCGCGDAHPLGTSCPNRPGDSSAYVGPRPGARVQVEARATVVEVGADGTALVTLDMTHDGRTVRLPIEALVLLDRR